MANVSDTIRTVLAKAKRKQSDLGLRWNTSRQAVSNKFYRDYWSADELVDIAKFTGCRLVFQFPDGVELPVDTDSAPRLSAEKAQQQ